MSKKRRHKEKSKEQAQDKPRGNEKCKNCFQNITNLIAVLLILQFICKALEEK